MKYQQKKTIKMEYEKKLDELETNIKNNLCEMFSNMYKHSIKKAIESLKYDLEQILEQNEKLETIKSDFETILKKTIETMLKNMIDEFKMMEMIKWSEPNA